MNCHPLVSWPVFFTIRHTMFVTCLLGCYSYLTGCIWSSHLQGTYLMVLTGCVIVLEIYCTKWIYPFPDFWSVLSFWDLVSFETSFVVCIMKEF
jgi:hypothetical protein